MAFKNLFEFRRSDEWNKFRTSLINKRIASSPRGELICDHCGKPIFRKYDCILHHKIELTEANVHDTSISLNESNIMVVHFDCHNEIHNRFGKGKRKVYIVHGAPCAGKNTFVSSVCKRDDLVIDMDMIYKMINTHNDMYDKPDRLKTVAFKVRETLLNCVRDRIGFWQNAYIITTEGLESQLNRMATMYGAELIHIDTDKETCIANLMADESKKFFRAEWMGYINHYFDTYSRLA
jgi:hypothetical protein